MMDHADHMRTAIEVAHGNPAAPFGAILIDVETGEVVAEGVNRARENPTWHGEIVAINAYAASGKSNWDRLRMYTTAEPCCMCQAAILWARIPEVVYGTAVATLRKLGWDQFDCTAAGVVGLASFTRCNVIGGVLADECDPLFAHAQMLPNRK
jgi:tRNA(Arg) A34 adenosine deaminase TadA